MAEYQTMKVILKITEKNFSFLKAKEQNFDVLALTVDTITGGNRERDLRTGFTIPPNMNIYSILDFLIKPQWTFNYLTHKKFDAFCSSFI